MERRLPVPRLIAFAAVAAVLLSTPADAQAAGERIDSYEVSMTVQPDGALRIVETIAYDFGTAPRHGIFRDIPHRVRYDDKHDRLYPIESVRVTAGAGTPTTTEVDDAGSLKRVRIGDPDRTITGKHTYVIGYTVRGALNGFDDHDELYWNAIGADWEVPISAATVRVTVPAGARRVACFSGPLGSVLPCTAATTQSGEASFDEDGLSPYEALTVVVAIEKGAVAQPAPILHERWSLQRAFPITPLRVVIALLLLAGVVAAVLRLAWHLGRDRRWAGLPVDAVFGNVAGSEEPVALGEDVLTPVEFLPPDGLRPGQVGTLLDETAHPLDVTATVVDLAVHGHLRIEEVPKEGWFGKADWCLVPLDHGRDDLRAYEVLLLDKLFDKGLDQPVLLSGLKNTFAPRLKEVTDALYDDVVAQGWFAARPDRVRVRWLGLGMLAVAASIGLFVLAVTRTTLALFTLPLIVGAVLLLAIARLMPRRTAKGTAAVRRVLGFRRFILESEKERARFAERAHLFSEYLPYAVVFGCAEKWARTFEGMDAQVPASWYIGSRPFTVSGFSHSIDGFATTAVGTISSTPGSSGSSGFGGGSSGGGGGGGGGSW